MIDNFNQIQFNKNYNNPVKRFEQFDSFNQTQLNKIYNKIIFISVTHTHIYIYTQMTRKSHLILYPQTFF